MLCRFHVNLQCGSQSDADIALHFNPRYEGLATVVLNTFQNCNWGTEERMSDSFLLSDQPFILQILVTKETYKVYMSVSFIHHLIIASFSQLLWLLGETVLWDITTLLHVFKM